MLKETYNYHTSSDRNVYYFESEGKQGKILKLVMFSRISDDFYNLGFGDLKNEQIDDSIVSNNHDIVKVMSTVAKIIYDYSNQFPLRRIRIKPVDEKRKTLYNHIFRRNYDETKVNFQIIGIINGKKTAYSPKKVYDSFELKRKFVK